MTRGRGCIGSVAVPDATLWRNGGQRVADSGVPSRGQRIDADAAPRSAAMASVRE
jgi:hypothetical protein